MQSLGLRLDLDLAVHSLILYVLDHSSKALGSTPCICIIAGGLDQLPGMSCSHGANACSRAARRSSWRPSAAALVVTLRPGHFVPHYANQRAEDA